MVHPQEQFSIEEITSPIEAQIFDFCESGLFEETVEPNSEVASSSNGCYDEQSSYNNPITPANIPNYTTGDNENKPAPPPSTATGNPNLSIIFDEDENDISESIDFTTSPSFSAPQNNQYLNNISNNINNSNSQEQFTMSSSMNGHHQLFWPPSTVAPIIGPPPFLWNYEDECMPNSVASLIRLRFCSSLVDPMMAPYLPSAGGISAPFTAENMGIFGGNGLMLGNDVSNQELDFQGDNGGLFLPDTMQRVFNCSSELQAVSSESQHLVHGGASEISSLEDPTFKVAGKLSVEERQRKIHRYLKKRNQRNFSKKIKYACRKTLADSRPRVRGRFAKNDELGELARITNGITIEDDNDEDVTLFSNSTPDHQTKLVVKEEDDMESSDIFAHISGVNSFKCNYPIQSWI